MKVGFVNTLYASLVKRLTYVVNTDIRMTYSAEPAQYSDEEGARVDERPRVNLFSRFRSLAADD